MSLPTWPALTKPMRPQDLDIASLSPWITIQVSRSPGPGGQNVNKVSTRVTLLLDVESCDVLTHAQKEKIREHLKTRISRDGLLRVVSSRHRTQGRNRATAETRLLELLQEALRPRKPRLPTKPTAGSRERRLASKRQRGETKQRRRPPTDD